LENNTRVYQTLYLTGSTGFIGTSLLRYFKFDEIYIHSREEENKPQSEKIVIHLSGKAHDLKNTSTPDEYYQVNTELTKKVFDAFLASEAQLFITLSSVKAVADEVEGALTEEHIPNPISHYGKSKLLAEQYILSKEIPKGKRVYILRPCMIHGPGNKGNLNLLYKLVSKNFPWPLGAYDNKRSFCNIDNLCFVIKELIQNEQIQSGIYNIADDESLSTNDLIDLISKSQSKKSHIWNIPKYLIKSLAILGDIFQLPLNTERLKKLTESYIVSNNKIKNAINKPLPVSAKDGLMKTFNSFNNA